MCESHCDFITFEIKSEIMIIIFLIIEGTDAFFTLTFAILAILYVV